MIHVHAVFAQGGIQPRGAFAIATRQQLLRVQIVDFNAMVSGEPVVGVDDELKVFRKQRPSVEPLPVRVQLCRDPEFSLPVFEHFADFAAVAAKKAKFQPIELPLDLIEKGISSDRSIEWVSAILSAPISPLLNDEASERAPTAAS
jgi:hypothetical protein